jgi:hypothetical protein
MRFERTSSIRGAFGSAVLGVLLLSSCGSSSDEIAIEASVSNEGIAFGDVGFGLLGTFTADGICDAGTWTNVEGNDDSTPYTHRDQYSCEDGSGTFFVNVELTDAREAGLGPYDGTWSIVGDGLGDHSKLTASGTIAGADFLESYEGSKD